MSSFDINTLLKPTDTLSDEDKQSIIENRTVLNEEEVTKFKDFLPADAPTQPVEPTAPETPAATTADDPAITKGQLDTYLEQKRKEWAGAGATKTQVIDAEKQVRSYFKEGELPKDWNDAFSRYHDSLTNDTDFKEKLYKEFEERYDKKLTAKQVEAQTEKLNKKYDDQYKDLFKEGKVPDPKTPEGQAFDKMLATVAVQFNKPDYKEAYAKYVEMTTGITPAAAPVVNPNKKAASLVGGGGVPAKTVTKPSYRSIHNAKSLSSLIDD